MASKSVRWLLASSGLIAACAVAAVAMVVTRAARDPRPPVTAEAVLEADAGAGVEAETGVDSDPPEAEPVLPLPARPKRPVVAWSAEEVADEGAETADDAEPQPDDVAAREQAEKDHRKAVARAMAKMTRQLGLTPEQIESAGPAMDRLEEFVERGAELDMEKNARVRQIDAEVRDMGLPKDQTRQLIKQRREEYYVEIKGEWLDMLDLALAVMRDLRPHMAGREQEMKLDKLVEEIEEAKTKFLRDGAPDL